MPDALATLRAALAAAWQPPPRLSVSEVAERHLWLSSEYSAAAGFARFDRYPYLREPIDRLGTDDPCRVVVFRGPIQGGKTIIGQAWLTDIITAHPGPTLWVTDTDGKAEIFSKKRLALMIRDAPGLRPLVADAKSRTSGNTLHFKTFPGGDIKLVGAQASTGLTSDTCRYAVIDEADDHRANLSSAGSSISLAMGRQTTYGDLAKTLIVSSPKVKGDSEIDSWHDRGNRCVFEVPCPECGVYQELRWRDEETKEYRLRWPAGRPDLARYVCPHCSAELENADKNRMLPHGRWVATHDGDPTIASYSLNALYLPVGSYSWPDMARQWDSATTRLKAGDTEEHRSFCNTRLAESYETPGDTLDPHALGRRVEDSWGEDAIPDGVRVVTTGTDVQDDRLETMVVGWGLGWEVWLLDYHVILRDPRDAECWRRHDELLRRRYTTEDGRTIPVGVACVDRGHLSQQVLEYTSRRRGVHAVKGVEGTPRDAVWDKRVRRGDRNKNKTAVYFAIRVVPAKDTLAAMLRTTAPGPRYVHIPRRLLDEHPDILDQLTSERRTSVRDRKNRRQVGWVKAVEGRPNEAWDCFVYCLAGAHSLTLGGLRLEAPPEEPGVEPGVHHSATEAPKVSNVAESQAEKQAPAPRSSQSEAKPLTRRQRMSQHETRPGRQDPRRWFG
jgi:phage terminase large subunit GpA-like protein